MPSNGSDEDRITVVVDYDIPIFFRPDRQAACRFVEGFLLRFHRKG